MRWFHCRDRRDGPLFRGRFLAKRIDSLEGRRAVACCIDADSVAARIVARAEEYPHSSTHKLLDKRPPLWLNEAWTRKERLRHQDQDCAGLEDCTYFKAFPRPQPLWVSTKSAGEPDSSRRRKTAKLATREPGGSIKLFGRLTAGLFSPGSPDDRSFEWAMTAPGMRTVYGDANDSHNRDGERYLARVRFQPGWSTRVLVHGPGGDPLGQAQVFLDGVPSGATDSKGLLELAAEAPPTSWSVTYADWLPPSGQFPAPPGAFGRENLGWQLIEMRAPDKPAQR